MVRGWGGPGVYPPPSEPIAQGLPGSSRPASSVLSRPLRAVCPIGWIGGRYTTSKPISATARKRLAAPSKPPSERGNSSYHAPYSARRRSTLIGGGGTLGGAGAAGAAARGAHTPP